MKKLSFLGFIIALLGVSTLCADYPRPWEMNFQDPATPVMEKIKNLHDMLLWIEAAIAVFVIGLLAFVIVRFRASKNPNPSKVSHNTLLEIVWTTVPVIILIVIAIPSFKLLYFMDVVPKSDLTIKAVGHQWYWSYEYPDHNISFDSFMVEDKDLKPDQMRLLATDTHVVVPTNTNIRVITTSADVLHSWAVPSFGVKRDSVPGRLNETWFNVQKEGLYYGQCSELCGTKHGFMPIVIEAVSPEQFKVWLAKNSPAPVLATPAEGSAPVTPVSTPAVSATQPTQETKK